ncbi:MAG: 3'-5' exonuclease [Pseudomonadota bacterium]|nr:3'-5' exonuclease [Pseudomonadota bacterium]
MTMTLEKMAQILTESGHYKVLKAYEPPSAYYPDDGCEKRIGLILDTEDTGTDYETDTIIELGMVKFEYDPLNGRIFRILEHYDEYNDPGYPLPEKITQLTGITDTMLAGKRLSGDDIHTFVQDVNLVIAHNAGFDRKFCEALHPDFIKLSWACSMKDIDWPNERIESRKLDYIAAQLGFFFTGHRAVNDCLATLHILSKNLPVSGSLALQKLLEQARKTTYRIYAINAPFAHKDILRKKGYAWNDGSNNQPKAWFIEVTEEQREGELDFLYKEIYQGEPNLPQVRITARNRYSNRI